MNLIEFHMVRNGGLYDENNAKEYYKQLVL